MNDRPQDKSCEEHGGSCENSLVELQSLLDRQIEQAQQGNFAAVDALSRQSGQLIERLTSNRATETMELKAGKAAIQDSYRRLLLTLDAARQDIAEQLSSVRQGKKLVRAYRKTTA
jgi:hypothetical protein